MGLAWALLKVFDKEPEIFPALTKSLVSFLGIVPRVVERVSAFLSPPAWSSSGINVSVMPEPMVVLTAKSFCDAGAFTNLARRASADS